MAAVSSHRLATIVFSLFCLPIVISSLSLSSGFSRSFDFNFSQPASSFNHPDLNVVYLNSTHPQSQDGRANASSVHPKIESEVIHSNSSMEMMISKGGIGRVSYTRPVLLWDEATGEVANFSMSMTFCLHHQGGRSNNNSTDATRMAMFLEPYQPTVLPPPMMNSSRVNHSNANAMRTKDQSQTMEVEFDAYLPPEKLDNSGCRRRTISVDVNYIVSIVQVNTTVLIPSDAMMMNQSSTACTMMILVQMDYDGGRKRLDSSIRIGDVSHHINASVDLSKIMPKEAGIGFRSTTGQSIELQNVLRWSFNSTLGHTDSTVTVTPPPQTESQHQNSQHFWKQFLVRLDPWNGNAELNLQLQFQRIWERINLVISTNFNVTLAYVW